MFHSGNVQNQQEMLPFLYSSEVLQLDFSGLIINQPIDQKQSE